VIREPEHAGSLDGRLQGWGPAERQGGGGEDLLAQGVRRSLPEVRYSHPGDLYARIDHPEFRTAPLSSGCASRLAPPAAVPPEPRGAAVLVEPAQVAGERLLLVDLETLGFVGRPVFLVGALMLEPPRGEPGESASWRGRIIQYLARDYSEEEGMLAAFLSEAPAAFAWVSFNGRSFDLPSLIIRAAYHRLPMPAAIRHLDLLPVARRLWGAQLPDCRLQTLEQRICGCARGGDIEGASIPAAYHAFVRSGEPWDMLRILQHNAADLASLWRILREACSAPSSSESP